MASEWFSAETKTNNISCRYLSFPKTLTQFEIPVTGTRKEKSKEAYIWPHNGFPLKLRKITFRAVIFLSP